MARGRIFWSVLLRAALVFGAAFELFGCAAPAAVTVASVAADGASLAATGKSMSDHAISAISGKDCSTLDLIDTGVLCHDRPAVAVHVVDAPPPFAAPPPAAPPPLVDNSAATFLALGSFPDWDSADKAVVYAREYVPLIVPLEDGKGYSVVAGRPLAGGDDATPIAAAKKLGFKDARTVTLCRATYRPGPCNDAGEESDVVSVVDAKIKAAQRPGTSIAQRFEPAATEPPTKLY